jgi:hypothetical protein
MRKVVPADAYSAVADFYDTGFVIGRDQDLRLMIGGIFTGIIQQIGKDSFEQFLIAFNDRLGFVFRNRLVVNDHIIVRVRG